LYGNRNKIFGVSGGPEDKWRESLPRGAIPAGASDRRFGLRFSLLFAVLAILEARRGAHAALGCAIAAALLFVIAWFAPALLGPLNRSWRRLGLQLAAAAAPIVMGVLFFLVLTPIGLVMRAAGRDPLRLRFEPDRSSYWLPRAGQGGRQTSMTRQL
jgi:hypothetical protein